MTDQETEALVKALGLDGPEKSVAVLTNDDDAETSSDEWYVVMVQGRRIIVVAHGWGASGAHIDVRCFVDPDDPQQVTPDVMELDRTVSIYNSYR